MNQPVSSAIPTEYLRAFVDALNEYINGSVDLATARLKLQDKLTELGYEAPPGEEGEITDLSSDVRLNMMLRLNAQIAEGYGYWKQRQEPVLLAHWPAQELIRVAPREKTRDQGPLPWRERWKMAGGKFFDGRVIAPMNDEVWNNLGSRKLFDDSLGNPYPPFAFNSGMGVRAIDRSEATELGVIDRDTQIEPQTLPPPELVLTPPTLES
jgi:hypothetical protein